jgi:hypothetical protein
MREPTALSGGAMSAAQFCDRREPLGVYAQTLFAAATIPAEFPEVSTSKYMSSKGGARVVPEPSNVAFETVVEASPKWSGPEVAVVGSEFFEFLPFQRSEIATHVLGGMLNAIGCGVAIQALLKHRGSLRRRWLSTVRSVLTAMYSADLVSGLLHWAFDTWFDETNVSLQRMVRIVREHHIYPQKIFNYGVHQEVGLMSWFGLLGLAPACLTYIARTKSERTVEPATLAAGLVYSLLITFSLEFHKLGHRFQRGRLVQALQAAHLILSPEHHMKHHAREHDAYYCLVNGIGDLTLGRLGFFRFLESTMTALTGMKPRDNDRRWRRGFGRWIAPD